MPTPTYTPLATITLGSSASSDGCEIFDGYISELGYGAKRYGDKVWKAHRLAWTLANGEIPAGMVVDHTCHNEAVANGTCEGGKTCKHRACVNLEHLRLTTQSQNTLDGANGFGSRKFCKQGHALENNIYTHKNIQTCYTCRTIGMRKARAAYKARKAS
jgi:hypothetical protein